MRKIILFTACCLVAALMQAGTAAAETVKGRIKFIAPEAQLFSLLDREQKVLLVSWNSATRWEGLKDSGALAHDEAVTVDYRLIGDAAVATSVERPRTPIPAGVRTTTIAEVAGNTAARLIIVDTRPREQYDAGHLPGALSIPLARLEKRTRGLLPDDKNSRLVFCDEGQGGSSAGRGAEIAAGLGYGDSVVLVDGTAGWTASGRVLAVSAAFIRKTNPSIIDVRTREQVVRGHIPGSVNVPAAELASFRSSIELQRLAPIVVYGDSDAVAMAAALTIRGWGFRNVTFYPGGAISWEKAAEVLVSGKPEDKTLSSQGHGGRLPPNDFKLALNSPIMVRIIDVRAAPGDSGFPNSVKIPLKELPARHGTLEREKILVVCAEDSSRAEMAYDFLASKGYRATYLDGSVTFSKDNSYTLR